jgi:hydroxyacylglutathione hydrolase
MTQLLAFRALRDNLVWVLVNQDGRALAVDPGEASALHPALDSGLNLTDILVTHHHPDHTGGVVELVARTGARVHAPEDARLGFDYIPVAEGRRFLAAGLEVDVMHVPGHTLTHVAFLVENHLFCGDTLFSLGCGRLFEGTPEQMHGSLQRLAGLPEGTQVCCGHEYTLANGRFARAAEPSNPAREAWLMEAERRLALGKSSLPSTIGIERAANPFLRVGKDVSAFAALRQWKDTFA